MMRVFTLVCRDNNGSYSFLSVADERYDELYQDLRNLSNRYFRSIHLYHISERL